MTHHTLSLLRVTLLKKTSFHLLMCVVYRERIVFYFFKFFSTEKMNYRDLCSSESKIRQKEVVTGVCLEPTRFAQ